METEKQSQFEMFLELREEGISESLEEDTGRSDSDAESREAKYDGSLEDRRRERQGDEAYDVGLEGDQS